MTAPTRFLHPDSTVESCRIIELPRIQDPRGNLTFVEAERHIAFPIRRVYYLYDVPGGETRAGHAHLASERFLVAMSGSFDAVVDDARQRRVFHLNRAYYGLYVPTGIWLELENFSSGAVCLSMTNTLYDAADYIRDVQAFRDLKRSSHRAP